MGYDIDQVIVNAVENARITMIDFVLLKSLLGDDELPERCFLDQISVQDVCANFHDVVIYDRFDWSGEGSGSTYKVLTERVLPRIKGWLELVIVWNGGDKITGVCVDDGKVIECDVQYVLVEKDKK